jgi:iron complex outermembrane receptor protein
VLTTLAWVGAAQTTGCTYTVSGTLASEHDGESLAFGTVYAELSGRGVQSDSLGYFELTDLCGGAQVLRFSHIGCDSRTISLNLQRDTQLLVRLHHHDNYVETVTVTAAAAASYDEALDVRATGQLSDVLDDMVGVSSLRTGTAAAKPVYDGVFGNRLSVQNNGIAQSGQQWGNDHAPEIDPWVAAYVRIVDGVEALRYAGPTVAATVLIEPADLSVNEESGGKLAYTYTGNGRGHTLNGRLTERFGRTALRVSGTGKVIGDLRAPDYFLNNTGRREVNGAVQLARFHRDDRFVTRLYYSQFNANIGVLRGSHIGNLTDLRNAIGREQPFFTEDNFSYAIEPPRQRVVHHLLRAETTYRPNEASRLWLRYGGQLNDRREYDVRRGGRSDRPALSLHQYDHQGEAGWHRDLSATDHLDAVLQAGFTDNENQPGTGVLPLIPDYEAWRISSYLAYHREGDRVQYHGGLRFDLRDYFVQTILRQPTARIVEFNHRYATFGASAEVRYRLSDHLSINGGTTFRQRAPEVNELHSSGLHQGVSGIEEGSSDLRPEHSLKLRAGALYASDRNSLTAEAFVQPVRDYIFLEPQSEFRLTVRGAFPVFLYRAGDVLLYGIKARWRGQFGPHWEVESGGAVVRGRNRSEGRPLVYIPPDNVRLALRYRTGNPESGWVFSTESYLIARQERLDPEQDFLPPPPAYGLVDLAVEKVWRVGRNDSPPVRQLHLRAAATNVLDTPYRDYLDRQRYFADAVGRSLDIRIAYSW